MQHPSSASQALWLPFADGQVEFREEEDTVPGHGTSKCESQGRDPGLTDPIWALSPPMLCCPLFTGTKESFTGRSWPQSLHKSSLDRPFPSPQAHSQHNPACWETLTVGRALPLLPPSVTRVRKISSVRSGRAFWGAPSLETHSAEIESGEIYFSWPEIGAGKTCVSDRFEK